MCRHVGGGNFGNQSGRGNTVPNWVYVKISVQGEKQPRIAFQNKARRATPLTDEEIPPLSFWNFLRPADDLLDEYAIGEPLGFDAMSRNSWYYWNITNWGTKWDACDVQEDHHGDTLTYYLKTAWAAPMPVFTAMSEQHPELTFNIRWTEEQGYGEEWTAVAGALEKLDEWSEDRLFIS